MSDVILVVLDSPEAAAPLLHAAACLAVLTDGGRVNVLVIRTPPGYATLTAEASLSGGLEALVAEEDQRVAKLKAAFDNWAAGVGDAPFTVRWSSVEGLADPMLDRKAAAPTSSWSHGLPPTTRNQRGGPSALPCSRPSARSSWSRPAMWLRSASASPSPGGTTCGPPRRYSPLCAASAGPSRCMCLPACARVQGNPPCPRSSSTTPSGRAARPADRPRGVRPSAP